jgi:hypothetical protein
LVWILLQWELLVENDLLFIDEKKLNFTPEELQEILQAIEDRKWELL